MLILGSVLNERYPKQTKYERYDNREIRYPRNTISERRYIWEKDIREIQ